jgi:hypothetical protein
VTDFNPVPGVTAVVELGLGDTRIEVGLAQFDVSRFDDADATFAGTEPSWIDVTCFTHEMEFTTGRERASDRFEPGFAQLIMDNETGWADLDPDNIATLTMRAGRALRIGIDHDEIGRVWLWRGFVDAIDPRYDPEDGDTIRVECIDALGEAGRPYIARVDVPVGAGERGNHRVNRILDAAKWPLEQRQVAETSTTMIGTELDRQALDLMTQCADSEGGAVFGDVHGRVAYRGRDWQSYPPEQPNDGTIGNVMSGTDPFVSVGTGVYTLSDPSMLSEVAPGLYVEA